MTSAPELRGEDRADFDDVLHRALATTEMRTRLRRGVHTTALADWLRERVEASRSEIAANAAPEYARYLSARADAGGGSAAMRPRRVPPVGRWVRARRRLLPALAVLAPLLASMAAVVFLLLGHVLEVADAVPETADALVRAGWTAAVIAVLTGAAALAGLLVTALRHRSIPRPGPDRAARASAVDQARETWQRALLERGMLPFLRARLAEREQARPGRRTDRRPQRPRIGYASPDYASPGCGGPERLSGDASMPRADRHDAGA
ncbi:hypothetical protein H8N01_12610 [Streptomyces sp. AC536]|uniref:hypothetical protein n=1 Tax=Streptomyces buecherae TaxID=2763006 RepID=UPI00164D44B7|nr:hypothetical protein [Streptomyces buecherae]MBC3983379.1 hypothetical protein [Streptomyces buecherae]QNJ43389.1 hypothetical protein H7H31_29635 [Streptomyces buecherae]